MVVELLVDYKKIIVDNNLDLLKTHVNMECSAVLFLIPSKIYQELNKQKLGNPRIHYINTQKFINSIQDMALFQVDKKKNTCLIIFDTPDMLYHVINVANVNLPPEVVLSIRILLDDVDTYLESILSNGFTNPYICNGDLCMYRRNVGKIGLDDKTGEKRIRKVIDQYLENNHHCQISISFDTKTVEFLRDLCYGGHTMGKNGKISQREVAGSLRYDELTNKVILNDDSITIGKEDHVDLVNDFYNFHSHPEEAYVKYNTHIGFPSCQDFLGYLSSYINTGTILHAVSTLEGLYIISINKNWLGKKKELKTKEKDKFIKSKYHILHKTADTPQKYLDIVNNITDKIFDVHFLTWDEASNKPINIDFDKIDNNCFVNIDDLTIVKKYFK